MELVYFGNKTLDQRLGANSKKNIFFLNFTPNLLLFLKQCIFCSIYQESLYVTVEIYSTLLKGMKENQECTNGDYSLTNDVENKPIKSKIWIKF